MNEIQIAIVNALADGKEMKVREIAEKIRKDTKIGQRQCEARCRYQLSILEAYGIVDMRTERWNKTKIYKLHDGVEILSGRIELKEGDEIKYVHEIDRMLRVPLEDGSAALTVL